MLELFEYHPWKIVESDYRIELSSQTNKFFTLGNKSILLPGVLEEDFSDKKYNLVVKTSHLLTPDWTGVRLKIDNQQIYLESCKILSHTRIFDLKNGVIERKTDAITPENKHFSIQSVRLLYSDNPTVGAIQIKFIPKNFSGTLSVSLDITNYNELNYWNTVTSQTSYHCGFLLADALHLQTAISMLMTYNILRNNDYIIPLNINHVTTDNAVSFKFQLPVVADETIEIQKIVLIKTDKNTFQADAVSDLRNQLISLKYNGFNNLISKHYCNMKQFWENQIQTKEKSIKNQQLDRYNIFQIGLTKNDCETLIRKTLTKKDKNFYLHYI